MTGGGGEQGESRAEEGEVCGNLPKNDTVTKAAPFVAGAAAETNSRKREGEDLAAGDNKLAPAKRQKAGIAGGQQTRKTVPRAPALVVFGLGNVGEEHLDERHNAGHRVLVALAGRLPAASPPTPVVEAAGEAAKGARSLSGGDRPWILLPPQGPINDSGPALRTALGGLGLSQVGSPDAESGAQSFLAVVDDVALPLGTIRLKAKGSSGGHNGLKSIEGEFGEGYHRLKIGIGGERTTSHVGGKFSAEEERGLRPVVERAAEAVELWLKLGPEDPQKVMHRINAPDFCKVKPPPLPDAAEDQAVAATATA